MASNSERVEKVLDFLNGVQVAEEIVKRVEDDPEHGSSSEGGVGVPLWVAQEILDARSKLPNQRFESIAQVEAVRGLGEDTMHDIFRSLNDPDSGDGGESSGPSSVLIPPSPGPKGPTGGIPDAWRIWWPRVAMLVLGIGFGRYVIPLDEPGLGGSGGSGGSLVLGPDVIPALEILLEGRGQDTLVLDPSVYPLFVDRTNPESALVELDPSFYSRLDTLVANSSRLVANNEAALRVLVDALGRWPPETTGSSAAGPLAFEHDIVFIGAYPDITGAECRMEGVLVRVEVEGTPGAPSQ